MKPVWYDPKADNPPWIKALADVRHMGTREGYCYHHVQAIMLAIDQYAETALDNREFFLNKPHGIGGKEKKIPYGAMDKKIATCFRRQLAAETLPPTQSTTSVC